MTLPQDAPDDLAACHQLIEAQQAVIDQLQSQLEQALSASGQQAETVREQQQLIEKLRHQLDLFKRQVFGQRRERFIEDPRQLKLFEVGSPEDDSLQEDPEESSEPPAKRRGHGRRRFPDELRREIIKYELTPEELPCPGCGKLRVKIGEQSSEQLEFQPAVLFVKQHVRFTYMCQDKCCQPNMVTAAKPPQPIDKGIAGPGLLAFVASSKLADHLPLNRLEDILTRYGIHVARSTQCDWMAACGELVRPLYALMIRRLLQSHVVGTDDTTVRLRDGDLDRTRTAYFWAYLGDDQHPYVCYDFTNSHARAGPERFLAGFEGYLQGDAYSGYIEIARASNGKIRHAGCWSHARRYYDRAKKHAPTQRVHEALAYISRLYDVERQATDMTANDRLQLRQRKSQVILQAFRGWLDEHRDQVLPSSPLGEAISYSLNQWDSLMLFMEDGGVPIDNNRTEHALRQQVLGRVNWLFVGSEKGGATAAVLYSLVATCKRLRIDPFAYLQNIFTRLPTTSADSLEPLLPDRWIKVHPQHRLAHREKEASQAQRRRRERRARRKRLQRTKAK